MSHNIPVLLTAAGWLLADAAKAVRHLLLPQATQRDAAVRARMIAHLKLIDGSDASGRDKRAELLGIYPPPKIYQLIPAARR